MSAGKAFSLVLLILLLLLTGWSLVESLGSTLVDPPLPHLNFTVISWSTLLVFFDNFVVALVLAGLITFSLLLSPMDLATNLATKLGAHGTGLLPAVRSVLLIIVVAGVVNGLWFGLFAPRAELRVQQILHQSRTAASALREAERLADQAAWETAEEQLLLHQALAGETELVADLLRRARAGMIEVEQQRRAARDSGQEAEPTWVDEASEMPVAELVSRAREYLQQQDFFSAHHFATLAIAQSRTPRQDARMIQAEALNAIERGSLARDEAAIRTLYRDKMAAYEAFRRGETIPEQALEAYYRFQDLELRIPEDPDVRRFAPEARHRAQMISFFLEEAQSNQVLPGRSGLFFINRRTDDSVELVSVDSLVRVRAGDFLYGIEVMRIRRRASSDTVTLHLRARYGKVIGDHLVMRAIPREGDFRNGADNIAGPVYFAGSPGDLDGSLRLHYTVDEFARFAGGTDSLVTLSLPELVRLSPLMERMGRSPGAVQGTVLYRLLRMGGTFILSISAIALGWRLRSRYVGRAPIIVLAMLPVVVGLVWWLITLLRYLVAASVRVLAGYLPLSGAILVVAGGLVVAIVLALFELARQTVEI